MLVIGITLNATKRLLRTTQPTRVSQAVPYATQSFPALDVKPRRCTPVGLNFGLFPVLSSSSLLPCQTLLRFPPFQNLLLAIAAQNKETNHRKLQNTSSNVSCYEFRQFQKKSKLFFLWKFLWVLFRRAPRLLDRGKIGNFYWYTLVKTSS